MKHKRWFVFLLAAVLMVTALSLTALAANGTETEPETSAAEPDKKATEPETKAAEPDVTVKDGAKRAGHGGHKHKKVAEPENAIGKQAAKDAALADAGVDAEAAGKVKARVSQLEDGTVFYKVSFTVGEQWYSYKIDALTGKILDKTTEDAAAHEAAKAERGKPAEKPEKSSEEESETGKHHSHGGKRRCMSTESVPETETGESLQASQ